MKPTTSLSVAVFSLAVLAAGSFALAQSRRTPSPPGAKVYFIQPKDGQTVKGRVQVVMGLAGMGIAPAGIDSPQTGHHHLLINVDKVNTGAAIPNDETHRHFGRGETETMLDLPAGKHTLQLVLADREHIPHNPPVMSPKITVNVTK
jgi:Domain of unknown function (DUF4399)